VFSIIIYAHIIYNINMYFPLLELEVTQLDLVTVSFLIAMYVLIKRVIGQCKTLKSQIRIAEEEVERASQI